MKKLILSLLGGGCLLAAQTGVNAQTLINGAGSSFDYPAFAKWFEAYGKVDPNVRFNYQSIGSGAGQKQLLNQTVDFGASDAPMTDASMSNAPAKILHIPVVAGGVAIIYNLKGDPKLKLDSDVIASIYLGNITKWNDPKITALNPGVELPDLAIVPVHRTEGSGTTFIFTDFLSSISPEWAKGPGKGTAISWPTGIGGKGNDGVAGAVKQVEGGLGYVELAYAKKTSMQTALVKNKDGKFVEPSAKGATAAAAAVAASLPANSDFRVSIVNAAGPESYPISSFTWMMIYAKQSDPAKGKEIVDFYKWAMDNGDKMAEDLYYAPLPQSMKVKTLARAAEIK